MSDLLERLRVRVPAAEIAHTGKVRTFFDILPNNGGLTEEYLYAHQPTGKKRLPVYSTNREPVGHLSDNPEVRVAFEVLDGPAILVARKGYGGRLSVVSSEAFIVHEDGYAIRPKVEFSDKIDLWWFAGHYSMEFQSHRSSLEGIGDFPRAKLWSMDVVVPKIGWQRKCAEAYRKRDAILNFVRSSPQTLGAAINDILSA